MKKNITLGILLVAIGVLVGGCATLFKGGSEKVSFGSNPDKAKVYVNGQYMGDTPVQLNLASKQNYTIEFRKDGYQSKAVIVNSNVGAGWVILDILGGLLPVVIDAATGSWMQLDQTNINAALEKQQ
jgi:hypothetical protein